MKHRVETSLLVDLLPKLELWQPSYEGFKLLVALGWKLRPFSLRVDLWRDEPYEKVEVIDPESIRHNIKPLKQKDLQKDKRQNKQTY